MTSLTEAVNAVTEAFPLAEGDAKLSLHTDSCFDLSSGGIRTDIEVEPALYCSRELAVAAWKREALTVLAERAPASIVFVDGPHLDKWHITVMDKNCTHRVVEPRWSVTSRIGLIEPGKEGAAEMSALAILEREVEKLKTEVAALSERVGKIAMPPIEPPAPVALAAAQPPQETPKADGVSDGNDAIVVSQDSMANDATG